MQIDLDTLRAALEGAVKPLKWHRYPDGKHEVWDYATDHFMYGSNKVEADIAEQNRAARILSAIDLDTLAAKLGGGNV